MTFYASGTHIKTDEWVEGFFSVSNGGIFTVAFETYGDIYYLKPSVVAIDDVSFREGESCPVIGARKERRITRTRTRIIIIIIIRNGAKTISLQTLFGRLN
jgi:hypothetical protein